MNLGYSALRARCVTSGWRVLEIDVMNFQVVVMLVGAGLFALARGWEQDG
jgi:hypothetical protein